MKQKSNVERVLCTRSKHASAITKKKKQPKQTNQNLHRYDKYNY